MQNLFQKLRKAYKALLFIALTTFAIVLFQNCSSRLSSSSSDANSTPINNDENSSESLGPIRTTPNLPTQRIRFKKLVSSNGYGSRCGISMNDLLFCEASQGVYGARTKGFKEVPNLGAVKKVALGGGFGCAITMDDLVKCWGLNTVAQLGSGSKSMDAYPPIYYPAQEIASLAGAKDISASQSSACAVTARNKVFCWGESLTDLGGILTPQEVVLPNFDQTVAKVFLDGPAPRGLLLTTDGKLFFSGNITLPDSVPEVIETGIADVSTGPNHWCAIKTNGTVRCGGLGVQNNFGQLGNGESYEGLDLNNGYSVEVVGISNAVSVAVAATHSCATLNDGKVKCWGANSSGTQFLSDLPNIVGLLGNGTEVLRSGTPTYALVSGVREMSLTYIDLCALLDDNSVTC